MSSATGQPRLPNKLNPRSRFMASMSYLGILCLVPLIFSQHDEYVSFHARQGLVLWIWGVLAIFSLYIPIIGAFFFSSSVFAITLLAMGGLLSVFLTKAWPLPIISLFAGRF